MMPLKIVTIKNDNYTQNKYPVVSYQIMKLKNELSPPFMREIFVENAQHCYEFRKKSEFKRNNVKTVYNETETLTFLGPRTWEIVLDYIIKKVTALRNLN